MEEQFVVYNVDRCVIIPFSSRIPERLIRCAAQLASDKTKCHFSVNQNNRLSAFPAQKYLLNMGK